MHLLDTNVYLAASVGAHVHHSHAKHWFEALGEEQRVGFCRATEQAFLRLLTQLPVRSGKPLSNREAVDVYQEWRQQTFVDLLPEPPDLESDWPRLATRSTTSPKLWMDAYLSAFAISGTYHFVTFDKAFRQFSADGLELTVLTT